ncbi:MAG: hypothetical protein NWS01_08055, partial [Burkholderiales bacterium]|nr:hypothetical protein [Burkholderiales bacterium]
NRHRQGLDGRIDDVEAGRKSSGVSAASGLKPLIHSEMANPSSANSRFSLTYVSRVCMQRGSEVRPDLFCPS